MRIEGRFAVCSVIKSKCGMQGKGEKALHVRHELVVYHSMLFGLGAMATLAWPCLPRGRMPTQAWDMAPEFRSVTNH